MKDYLCDFIFAKNLKALQPIITRTTASDHWPVTRSFVAASVTAQSPATCTAVEAAKHVGEIATVTYRVDGVHQSSKGNIFLNLGGKYPNQALTAWIPSAGAGQFSNPRQLRFRAASSSRPLPLIGPTRAPMSLFALETATPGFRPFVLLRQIRQQLTSAGVSRGTVAVADHPLSPLRMGLII